VDAVVLPEILSFAWAAVALRKIARELTLNASDSKRFHFMAVISAFYAGIGPRPGPLLKLVRSAS